MNLTRSLALLTAVIVTAAAGAQQIQYKSILSAPPVTSASYVNIQDLSILLPKYANATKCALITLDVPQPYAKGVNFPGLAFGIYVEDIMTNVGQIEAEGGFTYPLQVPPSFGRMPTTIVVRVPLKSNQQRVRAQWRSIRNSTGIIDSFASLSAITGATCN